MAEKEQAAKAKHASLEEACAHVGDRNPERRPWLFNVLLPMSQEAAAKVALVLLQLVSEIDGGGGDEPVPVTRAVTIGERAVSFSATGGGRPMSRASRRARAARRRRAPKTRRRSIWAADGEREAALELVTHCCLPAIAHPPPDCGGESGSGDRGGGMAAPRRRWRRAPTARVADARGGCGARRWCGCCSTRA